MKIRVSIMITSIVLFVIFSIAFILELALLNLALGYSIALLSITGLLLFIAFICMLIMVFSTVEYAITHRF